MTRWTDVIYLSTLKTPTRKTLTFGVGLLISLALVFGWNLTTVMFTIPILNLDINWARIFAATLMWLLTLLIWNKM